MGTFAVFEINSTPVFIMVDTCHPSKYSFGQPFRPFPKSFDQF